MVYVGKKGSENGSEDDVKIPSQYSGNAFDADGTRKSYGPEEKAEALRHAEELFRRGYVFDEGVRSDDAPPSPFGAPSVPPPSGFMSEPESARTPVSAPPKQPLTDERTESRRPPQKRPQERALGGIFDRITTEDILIGAIILMLLMSGSDDELLIMLAILLFC